MIVTNQTRILEIILVILTGIGKFIFVDYFDLKFWYILVVSLAWYMYVMDRAKQDKTLFDYWGFRRKGMRSTLRYVGPAAAVALIGFVVYGLVSDKLLLHWHLLPVLLLYPLWGIVQQFLIIGLIAGNLDDMQGNRLADAWIILITSVVFAIVHFPNVPLVLATLFLSAGYSFLYLRYRNLWVPGIFHGVMGAFFYFFVLGVDPWETFIGSIR